MTSKKHAAEQIITKLREAEVNVAKTARRSTARYRRQFGPNVCFFRF